MSLSFAKISQNWAAQNENDVDEEVEILHHRNKLPYNQCDCRRCIGFRYQKGIDELEARLGRQATQEETEEIYNRVYNGR